MSTFLLYPIMANRLLAVIKVKSFWASAVKFMVMLATILGSFGIDAIGQEAPPQPTRGRDIYIKMCAECHGPEGQGAEGAYDRPLVGDLSIGQLTSLIDRTMPEGDEQACVADDARAVGEFIYHAFYSEAAQVRNRPPKQMFSRLTAEQLRQSLADLYSHNEWIPRPDGKQGLKGRYWKSAKQRKKENMVLERIDPVINFDFGNDSPGLEIPPKDFSIDWSGGLKIDRSGIYEIIVRSTCSFEFRLGRHDRMFIDNHVQSGDKTEFRESIALAGGRIYPLSLNFIQRERKTESPPAQISVAWIVPGGVEEVIPAENFFPDWTPAQFSIQTPLPPDDRSYGFERGIKIDRDWDGAVTQAAIEFGQFAGKELWPDYLNKHKNQPNDSRQLLKSFLRELLEVAYRYHLPDQLSQFLVDKQVEKEEDDQQAIKRVLLIGLKSPRFLYPYADKDHSRSQRVGARLALYLLDSIPVDQQLRSAINEGKLESEARLREVAGHLIGDNRARAKIRGLVYDWLNISAVRDTKKAEVFGNFEGALVRDLQRSLDAMIEEIVWSETSDYRQFYLANWSYSTERIQAYYGSDWSPVEPWYTFSPGSADKIATPKSQSVLVKTSGADLRAGVLTHPYLTSRLAYFDASSPIHRGVFLMRNILGRTIQPPQDAAFTALGPDLHPDLTTRERTILQTSPEDCDSCHNRINSLGFALENWDAVGRFREIERNKSIDASGHYVNREGVDVQFVGASDLARYLANSTDAHQAFVRRAFQYLVKQPPAAFGPDTLDQLTRRFIESQFSIRQLVIEIAVLAANNPDPT